MEIKPGNETTEWKAWIVGICAALALGLGHIIEVGLLSDGDGLGALEIVMLVAAVLGSIGGVSVMTNGYIKGRSIVKASAPQPVDEPPANPT
jgi:hypothetical protein